jgi:hypothetical protein
MASVERTVKAIEKAGGSVLHAFPPEVIVASVPQASVKKLGRTAAIALITPDPIKGTARAKAGDQASFARAAWNAHLDTDRRLGAMKRAANSQSWGTRGRLPPDPPAKVKAHFRKQELAMLRTAKGKAKARVQGAPNLSIPVLVGRVAVAVVFVDSTVAQFKITDAEKSKVVSEITEGLNMLSGFEPRAGIQWFYDFKRPKLTLPASSFPSSNQNGWEDTWRNAAMSAIGRPASLAGMNQHIAAVKSNYNAQWAFALFITKYSKTWFAYYWGNHVVMDFGVDGWGIDNFSLVCAHETGHVFGCPDEYSSSGCNCTSLGGRYQIANGNCETCASPNLACLMKANTPSVCDYTRGHLGWNELAVLKKGTLTLKGTWTFDFETGVQGPPSGADIWWEQVNTVTRFLVPRSGAMLANMGKPNFDAVSYQTLKGLSYSATPINGSNNSANKLKAGTVIAIRTNTGRYAKMKINSYGYNLGISYVTYQ